MARAEGGRASPRGISREEHLRLRQGRVQELRVGFSRAFGGKTPSGDWTLELGCGHGHFLREYAQQHPGCECLGIDFCRDRIGRAERKRSRADLPNLHFLHAEAAEFLESVPPSPWFREIFVLFPDPWPKRRHRKNRLVTSPLLDALAERSAPGAAFFFRSDNLAYVQEVRVALSVHRRWRPSERTSLPCETVTIFQQKAVRYETVAGVLHV